ncbi:MAG TPA: YihY/virulence factor BrkB family protein [Actinocrinis sp.]|uniref:YihY/virulence factor BrkB family protein n=1 Tax=Actinocrinis sp. TaxID=1920516 RepID=UPI002DDD6230|nr:YihY/virulence factor BrkB family protein [Actinocrinis sp.]HEV3170083.1 YihY/virulence factor BrkB family protein [Actinocrinis sp.]
MDLDPLLRWLDRLQRHSRVAQFGIAVYRKFDDDQAWSLAALLAYYAFLAIFPLLLILVTALGIVLHGSPAAQQWVLHSALVDFPIIGDQLKGNIHSLNRTGLGAVVGLIGTAFGARGLAMSVQNAFNSVWGIPFTRRPPFWGRQLRALILPVVVGGAILVTGALSGVASVLGHRGAAVTAGGLAVSTVINAAFFVLGFRLAIGHEVPTRDFVRSACAAAVIWQALLTLGGYLIAHQLRHAEQVYGLFGLVLGLLAWLHIQAQLTLLVLEADVVRAQRLWPRALEPHGLEQGDRLAYASYAQAQSRHADTQIAVSFAAPPAPSPPPAPPVPASPATVAAEPGPESVDDRA